MYSCVGDAQPTEDGAILFGGALGQCTGRPPPPASHQGGWWARGSAADWLVGFNPDFFV